MRPPTSAPAHRGRLATLCAVALAGLLTATAPGPVAARPDPAAPAEVVGAYQVSDVRTPARLHALRAAGVTVETVEHGVADIVATPAEVRALRRLGLRVEAVPAEPPAGRASGDVGVLGFPPADSRYHDYAELTAEVNAVVAAHPGIARRFSLGTSFQGRDLIGVKISDNVAADESEPEVLFTHHQHAREHLTVEMAVYLLHLFTDDYGTDARLTGIVNSREIWILPDVNPDGGEYDIATGTYRSWRKNRQPNSGTSAIGTDLNRNWPFRWGCCGGSSGSPSSGTYRGSAPLSTPEANKIAAWVRSRQLGGVQQIRMSIDFHTFSELVMWPYGWTFADTAPGLNPDQQAVFATIGRQMAATNGYTPQQASDLYITDGSIRDFLWGDQRVFSYTFEMFPRSSSGGGFYPPDEVIARETSRNRAAVLMLLDYADCPYRAIGKQDQYCG
jgi:carboxypeptidase T